MSAESIIHWWLGLWLALLALGVVMLAVAQVADARGYGEAADALIGFGYAGVCIALVAIVLSKW